MGSLFSDISVDFMKIIESSIIGKKSPEACEDGMVVTDDFIAVIDGSTSKTPKHLNPDMKNGRYAMMLISEYIREELKADASADDFCQGVTAYIYNKVYEKLGVEERLKEHPEERLTASAILKYGWWAIARPSSPENSMRTASLMSRRLPERG